MSSLSAMPMTQSLLITTKRLDINSIVQLDRRFPETYGFWWEEYKPEEIQTVAVEEEETDEDEIIIKDAYWIDRNGAEKRELMNNFPVTLYVILENASPGEKIDLHFEDETEDGEWKEMSYPGEVNEDGIIIIKDFKLELVDNKKEEENGKL